MDILLILPIALAVDLALGEPHHAIHPVVWVGKVISFLDRDWFGKHPLAQFIYGAVVTLVTIGIFTASAYFMLFYVKQISFAAYIVLASVLLKSTFSLRQLWRAALHIKRLLLKEELDEARFEIRSLVSRNIKGLSRPLLVSATVESVAENACDSFVAPLFYFLLFGVPGAIAYRVVNTLDAMVGYHGKYEHLGKFASKLDDVLNFVPARLTALLLVLATFTSKKDTKASWRVAISDHSKTESPNAGWPMAAVAGALNVQLEKVGHYKLGRANALLVPETINAALKLVLVAMLTWILICFIGGVIYFVLTS